MIKRIDDEQKVQEVWGRSRLAEEIQHRSGLLLSRKGELRMKPEDKDPKNDGIIKTSPASLPKESAPQNDRKKSFYIVGMGGSAGSLEAFEQFFQNMPDDTGTGLCARVPSRPNSQRHHARAAPARHDHEGPSGEGRDESSTEPCLRDPAKQGYVHPARNPPAAGALHAEGISGCPSISFSSTWPRTRERIAYASSSPEWELTAPWV